MRKQQLLSSKFLYENAKSIGIRKDKYLLWRGSEGAQMAATLRNLDQLNKHQFL